MTNSDEQPSGRIAGRSIDTAVEMVVARDDSPGPDEVRRVLSSVAADGVVTWDAVDDALAHLSKVVSTPETRVELAAMELTEARDAAEEVTDRDIVRTRLETFERRLDAVESRVEAVAAELQSLVHDDSAGLYEVATDVRRLTVAANEAQHDADELQVDLEEFQRWLADAETRRATLAEEVDALDDSLERLAAVVDELAASMDEADTEVDAGTGWFDVLLRYRALEPLFSDLQRELAALTAWDEEAGGETADDLAALGDRLDDLRERWRSGTDRLDALARPAWRARFDERLSSFDSALEKVEPPVDWAEISAALDEARAGLDDSR